MAVEYRQQFLVPGPNKTVVTGHDGLVLASRNNIWQQLFLASYIGDPRDGIFRMSLLNGHNVYMGDPNCSYCPDNASFPITVSGQEHTTDWQLHREHLFWQLIPLNRDGVPLTTQLIVRPMSEFTSNHSEAVTPVLLNPTKQQVLNITMVCHEEVQKAMESLNA